jgi:hypothetical protein
MKSQIKTFLAAVAISASALGSARAQGTAFTYQGSLNDTGNSANGNYSLRFTVYDASASGNVLGGPITNGPVAVNNGLFTVPLDFGPGVFTGASNWLQIDAAPYSVAPSFTPLTPRQQITPAPYAIYAESAGSANLAYNVANSTITTASFATAGGSPAPGEVLGLNSGGTLQWLALSGGSGGSGWNLTGNSGTTANNFLGTTDSQPLELWSGNARALRLEPGFGMPNVIGGFAGNTVGAGNEGATIAGGGMSGYPNSELAAFGTVGGGAENSIQSQASQGTISGGWNNTIQSYAADSFIGGGWGNTIRSDQMSWLNLDGVFGAIAGGQGNTIPTSSPYAFIGGGSGNTAGGTGSAVAGGIGNTTYYYASAVGGGESNTASGYYAAVSGGYANSASQGSAWVGGGADNTASGYASMVPGGLGNTASGGYSFAAGDSAKAVNNGAFVWADASSGAPFYSTADNQFSIRATGGVRFLTGGAGLTIDGVAVSTGGGGGGGSNNGWLLTGNTGANPTNGNFLGTLDGYPLELRVSGQRALRLETSGAAPNQPNVIGGSALNSVVNSASGATIAGGLENTNGANYATIGGGLRNTIGAAAGYGTVGGGSFNTASGAWATVPGGQNNIAAGNGSFAAGRYAQTTYDGSFIWGDGTRAATGTGPNRFDVLATGGAYFWAGSSPVWSDSAQGFSLPAANEPLITRGFDPFSSAAGSSKVGLGRWGLFMEPFNLVLGIPGDDKPGRSFVVGKYDTSGNYIPLTTVNQNGNLACNSLTILGGSDLAEPFQISTADEEVAQGAVLVIDEENPGHLKLSDRPYDTHVAGVLSGANGIHPGIQMQQQGLLEGGKNVALTGRVYVQADASNGPIRPGDLLTTSATPGHAMKVSDHTKGQGAILGKAMTGLKAGKGMVLVLVSLQ